MLRLVSPKKHSSSDADVAETLADESQFNTAAYHPLTCHRLSFLRDNKPLINDVSLGFAREGCSVILGFNGAGKSLLLRLLHGMIKPTSGKVLWNGRPSNLSIRRKQAMVFQKPVLLRRSVIDNVKFVLASTGIHDAQRPTEILERVGLEHLARRPARLLSGGEQQRLALGRALATEPDILFLDEATSSLDPASVRAIEEIVSEATAAGTKVVMVTHDLGQARRLGGEIVFMNQGEVVETSSVTHFFEQPATDAAQAYLEGRLP